MMTNTEQKNKTTHF